jgi:hypothetical protein
MKCTDFVLVFKPVLVGGLGQNQHYADTMVKKPKTGVVLVLGTRLIFAWYEAGIVSGP